MTPTLAGWLGGPDERCGGAWRLRIYYGPRDITMQGVFSRVWWGHLSRVMDNAAHPSSSSLYCFFPRGRPPPSCLSNPPLPTAPPPRSAAAAARSPTASFRSVAPHHPNLKSWPRLRRRRLRRGSDHPSRPTVWQPLLLRHRRPLPHPQTLSTMACSAASTTASRGVGSLVARRCLLRRLHRPSASRKTTPYGPGPPGTHT
jgi:hypothetical protein